MTTTLPRLPTDGTAPRLPPHLTAFVACYLGDAVFRALARVARAMRVADEQQSLKAAMAILKYDMCRIRHGHGSFQVVGGYLPDAEYDWMGEALDEMAKDVERAAGREVETTNTEAGGNDPRTPSRSPQPPGKRGRSTWRARRTRERPGPRGAPLCAGCSGWYPSWVGPVFTTAPRTMTPSHPTPGAVAPTTLTPPSAASSARRVYIDTVGCQMNVLDSELVIAALKKDGYSLTDSPAEADVILFNTCSVRELAEEKTYSAVGRVMQHKRRDPAKVVGVIGCMAQKEQEKVRHRQPLVDLVVGTGQLAKIPELVRAVQQTRQPQYALSLGRKDAGRHEVEASFESYDPARDPEMRPTPFQAFVRVQIGCDKFCTYCVVPSTRGPEQSRPPDHIVQEVRTLVDQGCKEVTLIGQTVNSYVFDHGDGRRTRLSDLISRMHDTPGLERIKFVTNFPKDMTNDLLDAVRELPKVVKYLHVPVQSGCDEVLKRMKRLYTVAEYREMLHRCRERVPGVAVSSDFIVGFCGETDASFDKTMKLVEEAKFKNSFIFKYSERPGTKAAERYPDHVPEEVKKRRNNDLLAVQNANSLADHRLWIGKSVSVLVEGRSKRDQRSHHDAEVPQLTGRTMTDHIVVFDAPDRLTGHTVAVDIDDASGFTLFGRVRTEELIGVTGELPAPRPRRRSLDVV